MTTSMKRLVLCVGTLALARAAQESAASQKSGPVPPLQWLARQAAVEHHGLGLKGFYPGLQEDFAEALLNVAEIVAKHALDGQLAAKLAELTTAPHNVPQALQCSWNVNANQFVLRAPSILESQWIVPSSSPPSSSSSSSPSSSANSSSSEIGYSYADAVDKEIVTALKGAVNEPLFGHGSIGHLLSNVASLVPVSNGDGQVGLYTLLQNYRSSMLPSLSMTARALFSLVSQLINMPVTNEVPFWDPLALLTIPGMLTALKRHQLWSQWHQCIQIELQRIAADPTNSGQYARQRLSHAWGNKLAWMPQDVQAEILDTILQSLNGPDGLISGPVYGAAFRRWCQPDGVFWGLTSVCQLMLLAKCPWIVKNEAHGKGKATLRNFLQGFRQATEPIVLQPGATMLDQLVSNSLNPNLALQPLCTWVSFETEPLFYILAEPLLVGDKQPSERANLRVPQCEPCSIVATSQGGSVPNLEADIDHSMSVAVGEFVVVTSIPTSKGCRRLRSAYERLVVKLAQKLQTGSECEPQDLVPFAICSMTCQVYKVVDRPVYEEQRILPLFESSNDSHSV
jgi:hypothetical protein